MKKFKKIFAALAASALVAAMSFTSMAASITIKSGVTEGTDNTRYTYYKILNADILYNEKNEIQNVSYYVTYDKLAEQLSNTKLFDVKKSADGTRWNVEAKGTTTDAAAIAKALDTEGILNNAIENGSFQQKAVTDEGTEEKFKAVATVTDGYYLIKSSLGTVLAVQTTGDKGVIIKEKNEYPSLKKEEDITTAKYGDKIKYTVTVSIPNNAAENDIIVVDTMTSGLTPFDGTDEDTFLDVTAKVNESELTGDKAVTVDSQADNVIKIKIPKAAVKEYKGRKVVLTYQAVLNNSAKTNVAERNKAYLEYANYKSLPVEVAVKTYDFVIKKVDGDNNNIPEAAGDAEFTLWDNLTGGNQIKVSLKSSTDNTYRVLTNDETPTVIYAGGSANKHSATIEGLAAGTYYLQENQAPKGYNKLAERMPITVEKDKEAGENKANVQNNAGIQLPSTGGMGTTVFAIVGLLVMAGAAVMLIVKKRA